MQGACKWCKFLLLTLKCSDIHIRRQRLNWKSLLRFFFFCECCHEVDFMSGKKGTMRGSMLLTIEQRETVIASFHQPCQPLIGDDETALRLKTSNNTIFAPSPHTFVEEFAKKKKKVLWADFTNHASKYTLMFHFVVIIELWCPDIWTAP